MKQKHFFRFLMMMFLAVGMAATFSSCSSDDDDEPSGVVGKVTIINNSTYTLYDFKVIFTNNSHEVISRELKGTLKPNNSVEVDIPIGATLYYMGTTLSGTTYFSADYDIKVRKQVLTNSTVGEWTSN